MTRFLLLCLFVLLLSACQPADPDGAASSDTAAATPDAAERAADVLAEADGDDLDPPQPAVEFDTDRFMQEMSTLASNDFEGRAPGSAGEEKTLDFLVKQFSEAGLMPGYGDSYLQPVGMVELTNQARSNLSFQTNQGAFELTFPEQAIIGSTQVSDETQVVNDAEVIFVGYGIVAPEFGWNDYAGLDVEGKTVVMLVNDPGFAKPDGDLFNGRRMTFYGRWTYKFEEAARQGAAAAIIVHETEPASYPWEVVINSWSGAEFKLSNEIGTPGLTLEGWVNLEGATTLFQQAGMDYQQMKAAAAEPGFEARSMGISMSAQARNSMREGLSYNVLARIPGSERPDEGVIYVAHWDHLGRNLAIPGGAGIYNGAIDNASGTAGMIEMARMHMAAGPPERSVLFLAVTLEEYGLLGSRHYVNDPVFDPAMTAGVINLDAFNFMAGPTEDMVIIGYGNSELEDILKATLADSGRRATPESRPEAGLFYRSDHFNFARAGIPAMFPKSGVTHVELGREHGLAIEREYYDNRYHKPADEVNPDWDLSGIGGDMTVLYRVGRYLAENEAWPNWYEGNEFRALRDEQRPN